MYSHVLALNKTLCSIIKLMKLGIHGVFRMHFKVTCHLPGVRKTGKSRLGLPSGQGAQYGYGEYVRAYIVSTSVQDLQ